MEYEPPESQPNTDQNGSPSPTDAQRMNGSAFLSEHAFEDAFGERIEQALRVNDWAPGSDLLSTYSYLDREVALAIEQETAQLATIRHRILPHVHDRNPNLDDAGVYRVSPDDLAYVHKTILFPGGVEACDGTTANYDTLALRLIQVGVSLVSYDGDQGTWGHQLFQRELRQTAGDLESLAYDAITRRQHASLSDRDSTTERLSMLAQRGILRYAERAILADRATAPWRMGRGNPIPYELLTGGGSMDLAIHSAEMLNRLLLEHKRFVFVANSTRESGILTLGHALQPREYLVLDTVLARLREIVSRGHYSDAEEKVVEHFAMEAGPDIVIGVFRASQIGPPRVFYAHRDHVHEAALIAMADSVLLEHRGFPMLLDLANQVCSAMFPVGEFNDASELAYADAGAPLRYLSERAAR